MNAAGRSAAMRQYGITGCVITFYQSILKDTGACLTFDHRKTGRAGVAGRFPVWRLDSREELTPGSTLETAYQPADSETMLFVVLGAGTGDIRPKRP